MNSRMRDATSSTPVGLCVEVEEGEEEGVRRWMERREGSLSGRCIIRRQGEVSEGESS